MRVTLACLLAVTLSACESLSPVVPATENLQLVHAEHVRQVNSLASWTLEGRISIRLEEDAWHAGLYWNQIRDIYQIKIIAPFGQGGAQLDGSAYGVVLNNGEGEFRADSADQLLKQQFGWRIPVDGLRYWATGQPAPTDESDPAPGVSYNSAGYISTISQGGWQVEYRRYTNVDGLSLPGKIFLKHQNGLDVRLVVDNWKTQRDQVTADERG